MRRRVLQGWRRFRQTKGSASDTSGRSHPAGHRSPADAASVEPIRSRLPHQFLSQWDRLSVARKKGWDVNQHADPAPDDVRVLFVEDDALVAQMYRLKLELDGYSVEVAADGVAALEKAKSMQPDIIFLDIRLPKLDGLSVLEKLRADPATEHLPVVILSNW